MAAFLTRCRIGCQIALLGLIGVAGMLLTEGLNLWEAQQRLASDQTVAAIVAANERHDTTQIRLARLRRVEKNFLLREDDISLDQFSEVSTELSQELELLAQAVQVVPALEPDVAAVREGVGAYVASFNELARLIRDLGMASGTGLTNRVQRAGRALESTLLPLGAPAAQLELLRMVRDEAAFAAHRDPRFAEAVQARLPAFTEALDDAGVTGEARQTVMERMAAYQDAFARFAAAVIALRPVQIRMDAAYAPIEPKLERMDGVFEDEKARATADRDATAAWLDTVTWTCLGLIVVVAVLAGWIIGRGIARPIVAVTRAMDGLVAGDLAVAIPLDNRHDEIGTMIAALGVFRDNLVEAERLRQSQALLRAEAEQTKRAAMVDMAERIESDASAAMREISDRANAMTSTVFEMRELAARTGQSANQASGAAASALENAQTVASAAEELAVSIREISGQVAQSTAVVRHAVTAGQDTRARIEALNSRVGQIGAVADIIGDIAAKTNLLALNATIEAARAGEAGKGFAVVAGEVKQLANQTARSTEEIARHIAEVRAATTEATRAVGRIEATIGEVDAIAASIAAAVEEQGAATAEIARNVTETAAAVNQMNQRNAEVSREAADAGHYAEDVLASTRGLHESVRHLQRAIVRTVRTSNADVDRRAAPRHTVDLAAEVVLADRDRVDARVADLSAGGARITGVAGAAPGMKGTLRIGGAPVIAFNVQGAEEDAIRVVFAADQDAQATVARLLPAAA